MQAALGRREFPQAREVVAELAALAPDSARVRARVGEWKAEIAGAERKAGDGDGVPMGQSRRQQPGELRWLRQPVG